MLDTMLTALGSERQELEGLLAHQPWQFGEVEDRYRLRRETPKAFLATPSARGVASPDWPSPQSQIVNSLTSGQALGAQAYNETSSQVTGELAELTDIFVNLPRSDQLSLLGHARHRRR
jgi:nitroreductase